LPLDVEAAFPIPSANFSRTQSDSSPAYTPGLRLFAFPDRPAAAGAKEAAQQGYRQSDPAAGQQARSCLAAQRRPIGLGHLVA
jgi:hypothetical protein